MHSFKMLLRGWCAFLGLTACCCLPVLGQKDPPMGLIKPWHFGRYTISPRAYGYQLDEEHAGYFGGARYREYYLYTRGYGLAQFFDSIPHYNGPLLPRSYWNTVYDQWPHAIAMKGPHHDRACIVVCVPGDAEVWLEGQRTHQTGDTRTFVSPQLAPQQPYVYQVRARWQQGRGRLEQIQNITVQAGQLVQVQFPLTDRTEPVARPNLQPVPQRVTR